MVGLSLRAKKNLFFSLFKNYYLLSKEGKFAKRLSKIFKPTWKNHKIFEPFGMMALARNNTSDFYVYDQIFKNFEYEEVCKLYKKLVNQQDEIVIIDAGANAGYATMYFKKQFNNAKVYLIEPDNDNFDLCVFNMRLNNFANVKCAKRGLWGIGGENLTISNKFRDGKEWALSVIPSDKTETDLKSISLVDIIKFENLKKIDILKIDIEGAEKIVFEDDEHVNKFLSKTLVLCIEIHDELGIREDILGKMERNGFQYYEVSETMIAYNIDNIRNLS